MRMNGTLLPIGVDQGMRMMMMMMMRMGVMRMMGKSMIAPMVVTTRSIGNRKGMKVRAHTRQRTIWMRARKFFVVSMKTRT